MNTVFFEQWLAPLFYIVDPEKRLFFIYLLAALVLGICVLLNEGKSFSQSLQGLFSKRIWGHQSSQIDFQLMFLNVIIKGLFFILIPIASLIVAKYVARSLNEFSPDSYRSIALSKTQGLVIYTALVFIVLDFFRFFQHYLFHKIPVLWRFHKIHHSAEVMTPVTLYRTHPFESVVSLVRRVAVLGLLTGVFKFYTQVHIDAYMIFGVNSLDFVFNFLGSNLRHSHVWLSFGPLNYFFISPAQHQIHHSRAPKHHDKNLGFSLSIWDQLFGTFYQVGRKEFVIFGVRGERHKKLMETLKAPFK